jgi:NAD(P)-dependent dehydrogenase (short-subunit alcohol dehydrogenase family)
MMDRRWGRVLHVAGTEGWVGWPNRVHNVAAKAGLHGFTKGLATDVSPLGVTVNTVSPGPFKTPKDPTNYPGWDDAEVAKSAAVRRLGSPDEFGSLCAFLASDEAGYITGQVVHINGGRWMF